MGSSEDSRANRENLVHLGADGIAQNLDISGPASPATSLRSIRETVESPILIAQLRPLVAQ